LPALILPHYVNGNVVAYLSKNPSADILHLVSFWFGDASAYDEHGFQLRGIASALSYLHHLQIVHGDIKGVRIENNVINRVRAN
jgi:serine/threonine protein kinase